MSPQNDAGIQVYALGGLTRDDQLVAAFWNGAFEEVVLVDPVDAHATSLGSLGDRRNFLGAMTRPARVSQTAGR